jgi:hypothetical protein
VSLCGLSDDALRTADSTVSDVRMRKGWWIWTNFGGNGRGLTEVPSWNFPVGAEEDCDKTLIRIDSVPAEVWIKPFECKSTGFPLHQRVRSAPYFLRTNLRLFCCWSTWCRSAVFCKELHFQPVSFFWEIKRGLWDHFALSLSVCLSFPPNFCWQPYEITFLSACLWFTVPSVSYQRNTGDYFFP